MRGANEYPSNVRSSRGHPRFAFGGHFQYPWPQQWSGNHGCAQRGRAANKGARVCDLQHSRISARPRVNPRASHPADRCTTTVQARAQSTSGPVALYPCMAGGFVALNRHSSEADGCDGAMSTLSNRPCAFATVGLITIMSIARRILTLAMITMTTRTIADVSADVPSDRVVVGYFPEWAVYARNYHVTNIPAKLLTHINYAFLKPVLGFSSTYVECNLFNFHRSFP